MNEHDILVKVYYASASAAAHPISTWLEAAAAFEVIPIEHAGETIAAVLRRDAELHIASWTRPRGSTRAVVRKVLLDTIERWGYASTLVMADNPAGLRFCRRLGFEVEGADETDGGTVYRLTCRSARHA